MASRGTPRKAEKSAKMPKAGESRASIDPPSSSATETPPKRKVEYPGPITQDMTEKQIEEHLGAESTAMDEDIEEEMHKTKQEEQKVKHYLIGIGGAAITDAGCDDFYGMIDRLGHRDYNDFLSSLSEAEKNHYDSEFLKNGYKKNTLWRKVIAMTPFAALGGGWNHAFLCL